MRLSILDHGHRRRAKLFLTATSALSRVDSPDIVKMLLYRPDFLSRSLLDLTAAAMRGRSYWTAGEREYLAMCTAQWHQCPFCVVTHAELTRIAGHGEIDPDNPTAARPELRQVREFLDTVSRAPDHVDIAGIASLPEQAVLEALHVNLVWNVVNRLANAFGFELREGQLRSGTRALHRFGSVSPVSSSSAATTPTVTTRSRTSGTRCSTRLASPNRRCARPPRPATRSPSPGSPTPRPSATPRTR
jgi:AhpD family alkylhydroperoxidase